MSLVPMSLVYLNTNNIIPFLVLTEFYYLHGHCDPLMTASLGHMLGIGLKDSAVS